MTDHSPISRPIADRPVRLPSLAVVDASGVDVVTFLQGQLSNDLAGTGASRACMAGYCSPKGRLLALPSVLTLADGGLRLIAPGELIDGLLQRLRMFVMRADVTFTVRDDLVCLGLEARADAAADASLAHGIAALPPQGPAEVLDVVGGAEGAAGAQMCRWHDVPGDADGAGAARRYLIVVPRESVPADLPDGDVAWRHGDIAAGIPRITAATREAFVPQMVNLQLVGGLSFRKGCYPGQEIVARMQYLGKLKRHMRRFRIAADVTADAGAATGIGPGTALAAGDDADAGLVVDAVPTSSGIELLAVVRIAADPEALAIGGAPLEPLPLPYAPAEDAPTAAPAADG